MADYDYDMPAHMHGKHGRRKGHGKPLLYLIIAAIIIVVAIALVYFFGGNAITVGSGYTAKITKAGSLYNINGKDYMISLAVYNPGSKNAYLYLSETPVFVNPTLNITLAPNSSTKVAYSSSFAEMQFSLVSANASAATVLIAPLTPSLQIQPDSVRVRQVSYSVLGGYTPKLPGNAANQIATTSASTTVSQGASTSSVASTVPTTTVSATNATADKINTILTRDDYYALMLNFSRLYAASASCKPQLYNTTYVQRVGHLPSGPLNYVNVSSTTPYALSKKVAYSGSGNYKVTFTALTQSSIFNNTVALEIVVNMSSSTVKSNTLKGIFAGATYDEVYGSYQVSDSVTNACAALITS